jgi:tetratricopeptide (TPR) repeat protein
VHLAQVLMGRNPLRGEPLTEARELLTSVLEVDPKYQCSLCALQNLAMRAHDWEAFEHYEKMSHARDYDGDSTLHLEERIFFARAMDRTAELDSLLAAVDTVTDDRRLHGLHDTGHMVQAYFGDIPLFARLERSSRPPDSGYPEWDHAWEELYLERTMGHMTRSLEYVRELGRLDHDDHVPLIQRQMPYLVYVDPDLSIPRDHLEEARAYLEELPPGTLHYDTDEQRVTAQALWEPLRRHYLGLVHSRLGSLEKAEDDARALDEQSIGLAEYAGVLDAWARTVRADIAYREGAFDRVIELVEGQTAPVTPDLRGEARLGQSAAYAQMLLTDALLAVGRHREALRWLNYARYVDDGLSYAFQAERMGQAYEAVGDLEAAAAAYARFVEAWADADPELQPRVEAARGRIEEILAEIG